MTFQLEDLLALPMMPAIRIRIGPGPDDVVLVDQTAWETNRERFVQFCLQLPTPGGLSWRILKAHTGQNGLMAKLLIALGSLAGVWRIHPDPSVPELWHDPQYPMILAGSVQSQPAIKMVEEKLCPCCERPMGPAGSLVHDLYRGPEETCWECHEADCEPPEPCKLDEAKKPIKVKVETSEFDAPDPVALANYLSQFGEPEK